MDTRKQSGRPGIYTQYCRSYNVMTLYPDKIYNVMESVTDVAWKDG